MNGRLNAHSEHGSWCVKVYLYERMFVMRLVVAMLTAGLAFDRPHVWDSQRLDEWNAGQSLWTTHKTDWTDVQQQLSKTIQASPGIYGMVYTTSNAHTTSRFRVDLCERETIWSVVIECYRIGAYHRTLPYIPNDGSILMVVNTPFINEDVMRGRMETLKAISKGAQMKRVSRSDEDGRTKAPPASPRS